MQKTKIEWCDITWNPITGCKHGCKYCYAERIAKRFGGWTSSGKTYHENYGKVPAVLDRPMLIERKSGKIVKAPFPYDFEPTFHRYRLDEPAKIKTSQTIFVCSMSDLFGWWVPDEWIEDVFWACEKAPQHRYLFLTKNPNRYEKLAQSGKLPQRENMWYGSTLDNMKAQRYPGRLHENTFISIEPLTEQMHLGIGSFGRDRWIIIGAETGNRKGKIVPKKEWIDKICEAANLTHISVFMKESVAPIVGKENMRREFPWGNFDKDKLVGYKNDKEK